MNLSNSLSFATLANNKFVLCRLATGAPPLDPAGGCPFPDNSSFPMPKILTKFECGHPAEALIKTGKMRALISRSSLALNGWNKVTDYFVVGEHGNANTWSSSTLPHAPDVGRHRLLVVRTAQLTVSKCRRVQRRLELRELGGVFVGVHEQSHLASEQSSTPSRRGATSALRHDTA